MNFSAAIATTFSNIKTSLRSKLRLFISGIAVIALLAATAQAILLASGNTRIKLNPQALTLQSSGAQTADERTLEQQTASALFDRDTTTVHTAYGNNLIDIKLEKQTEISDVRFYGAAEFQVQVQSLQGGLWTTIPGLNNIKLANQPAAWNTYAATQSTTTDNIRFILTPNQSGNTGGGSTKPKKGGKPGTTLTTTNAGYPLPEIEIWGKGEHTLLADANALVTAIKNTPAPAQARLYIATPVEGVIGATGHSFKFTLNQPARNFKRAYLAYETFGVTHWVSPVRRINGKNLLGGAFIFAGKDWTPVVEPIHPDWLLQGSNTVEYTLPTGAAGTYSVRNVRAILELDDGNSLIQKATTTQINIESDNTAVIDGDLATGWSPYNTRYKSDKPALTLYFDKPTQLDTLSLNLANTLSGTMGVDILVNGQWQNAGLPAINVKQLSAGWNNLSGFAQLPATALRLNFQNGDGSTAEIRDINLAGSAVGPAYLPAINISYPDAGQFYGREAYIRGYLSLPDNGSGSADISIAGIKAGHTDGSFGLLVNKEQAGYGKQADAEPWQVTVEAVYPDGQKLTRIVKLTQHNDASKAHGLLPNAVNPGFAAMLVLGETSLEIGPDATEDGIKIKITPLSEKELPRLDPGMTNVTKGPHKGYRFTPTPYKFKKNIKVTLPFDSAFVPAGHNENDIKTYYFDTEAGHWVPLDRVLVDNGKKRITSLTNHFTDMINATLTVPDHPEAVSFNPTQIKDIKAADPGAGINLIEPPQANNNGDARLSYPIEIPQGRQGMQPQLAISYNSAGGNGWLGQGWDLSVPSISIETRWGVPRYDAGKESETYVLNGEQLVPLIGGKNGEPGIMPHRAAWDTLQTRVTDNQYFVSRVEGAFRRIIRHGTNPTNYWWEVIDKNGVKNFYGGTPETGKLVSTVLESTGSPTTNPGIFKWMLKKTVDINSNAVIYNYDRVCDTGIGNGVCGSAGYVDGTQLYLANIAYTAHSSINEEAVPYRVEFVRDSARTGYKRNYAENGYDASIDRRHDVQIDSRGGFKQVTSERLKKIIVKFNNATIRSYDINYREGVFGKSLLATVVQNDSNGIEFNRHAMDYYNDVPVGANAGEFSLFTANSAGGTELVAGNQNVFAGEDSLYETFTGSGLKFNQTLIGGTYGRNVGFNGSFGVGMVFMGTELAGVMKFSASSSTSEGKVTLLDIDGDGKPDKVFLKNGNVKYRKNVTPLNGQVAFEDNVRDANSLSAMSHSSSDSSTIGFSGYAFGGVGSADQTSTTSTDKSYFADVNGDGLIDHVNNGRVTFGFVEDPTRPELSAVNFSGDSLATTNPIKGTAMSTAEVFAGLDSGETELRNKNPMMDAVRRWSAPYDGEIRIEGTVQLYDYTDSRTNDNESINARKRYKTADGVFVAIQKNGVEYWRSKIEANDSKIYNYAELSNLVADPQPLNRIKVSRGDRIYFRVASGDDGSYDRVTWAPRIAYIDGNSQAKEEYDVNNLNLYRYDTFEDTIFAGIPVVQPAPYDGDIHFSGVLQKAVTTDDVKFRLDIFEYNEQSKTFNAQPKQGVGGSFEKSIKWNEQGEFDLSANINVETGDKIILSMVVDSPIDLKRGIQWAAKPAMYYTAASQKAVQLVKPPEPQTPDTPVVEPTIPTRSSEAPPIDMSKMEPNGTLPATDIPVKNDKGEYAITLPVRYNADIYSADTLNGIPQKPWKAAHDGVLIVTPWLKVKAKDDLCPRRDEYYWWNPNCESITPTPDGDVTFTVKRRGERLYKKVMQVRNESVVGSTNGYEALALIEVKAGDELFFDFSSRDIGLLPRLSGAVARFEYGSQNSWRVPFSDTVKIKPNLSATGGTSYSPSISDWQAPKVVFVVRRGAQLLARKDFTMDGSYEYAAEMPLDVAAGQDLSFDYFTVDENISISNATVWTSYPGPAPWNAPREGKIEIHPALTFKEGSNASGSFTLRTYNNSNQLLSVRTYNVQNGVVAESGSPTSFTISAGTNLRFEYSTEQYLLSSDLVTRAQIRIDYADTTPWIVPSTWEIPGSGVSLDLTPEPVFKFGPDTPSGVVKFSVWRGAEQLGEADINIVNGVVSSVATPLHVNVHGNDELNFIFASADAGLIPYLKSQTVKVQPVSLAGVQAINAPASFNFIKLLTEASALHILMPKKIQLLPVQESVLHFPEWHTLYGNSYRGWAQAAYLDGGLSSNTPLKEDKLILSQDPNQSWDTPVYPAMPTLQQELWNSADDAWAVAPDYIKSTRRGLKFIDIPRSKDYVRATDSQPTAGIVRVPRYSSSTGYASGGGYILSYTSTRSTTNGRLELMDLNGDRYPDIVSGSNVQYTTPDGGMAEFRAVNATRETKSTDHTLAYGGGTEPPTNAAAKFAKANEKPVVAKKTPPPITGSFGMGDSDGIVDYIDLNGDGLPDRVSISNGTISVALNRGYEFFGVSEVWGSGYVNKGKTANFSFGAGWSHPGQIYSGGASMSLAINSVGYRLMDMNGDGLPDYVYADGDGLKVAVNYGGSFGPAVLWGKPLKSLGDLVSLGNFGGLKLPVAENYTLSDGLSTSVSVNGAVGTSLPIPCPIPCIDIVISGGGSYGETVAQPTVGFNDINGDGYIDTIRSRDGKTLEVALSQIGKTNLLKEVRRPLGARFEIDYIRSGSTYAQPHSKYVMAEVRLYDGVANDTPSAWLQKGTDWQRHSYAYENGQYDRFERDFLGYQVVTSYQHDTRGLNGSSFSKAQFEAAPVFRKTVQEYSNSHVYDKGHLLKETLFDGSAQPKPYVETINSYDFWKLRDSTTQATDPLQLNRFTDRATTVLFPRLINTEKRFYEGKSEAGQSSYTTHGYDALGNITDFAEGGRGVEEVSAKIEYANCDSLYLVGKPNVISVKIGTKEVRRREGDINCATGNLDHQRAFVDSSRYAKTSFLWDDYGNLQFIEGPQGSGGSLKLSYQYDGETHTYPVQIDNDSYVLTSKASYVQGSDYSGLYYGKPLATFDVNGNEIRYRYDTNGRTETITGPQEIQEDQPWTIKFTYNPYLDTSAGATGQESWAKTEHADRSINSSGQVSYKTNDPIETVLFTDGTKRVLQTKKDAAVSAGKGAAAQNSMIVSGRVAMDALGRSIAQYYPTAQSKGGSDLSFIREENRTANPTVTEYDVLDRATLTILPDGTDTRMEYDFGRDAFAQPSFLTTVTDANGNTKLSHRNVRELITTVTEYNRSFNQAGVAVSSGKAPTTTKYVYDPLKQITLVIDHNQNITKVEYDQLGRRTIIDNPDTGKVVTIYDDASNPIKKITAKLGEANPIEYDYDYSRLIAIRHPLYPDADVTYTYGTSSDKTRNQAGRIKQVKHQSGTEVREYGKLGEVVRETLTLTAAANGGSNPPVYTTGYSFDSFGRLHQLTMPDGEVITNHYDSGGNLSSIDGTLNGRPYQYLERLDYDEFESRVYLKVGNGVATEYSYDPKNRRLAHLKAGTPGKNAMQDMAYGYDAVGNIKSLIDTAPIPKNNEYGGKLTQTFDYDDLYRLVKADGEYTTAREVQNYQFAMAYDAIHNITHKKQTHTVSKIGGTPRIEAATTYDWDYRYPTASSGQTLQRPHAPIHIGDRSFEYDANGNQTGWQNDSNGTRRTIVWDENNRIREVQDPKHGAAFSYDDQGERKLRKSQYGETAYINQFFTVRNGAIASTHVFAGTSRVVTKVGAGTPVGKVANLKGTGNLNLNSPTGGDIVVGDIPVAPTSTTPQLVVRPGTTATPATTTTGATSTTTPATTTTTTTAATSTAASTSTFPGQGLEHRSDRANEVARNTEKNKHLNGGDAGGDAGSANSNAGGNGPSTGSGQTGGNNSGNTGNTGSNAGGVGGGTDNGGNTSTNGNGGGGQGNGREFIFFYHPDHLGSTGYVTDEKALRYEHITYFPFGETWVQESNATWRVPYQFTSKEMDQETGLYYFGARYYDPRTSVWQSADPILERYLDGKPAGGVYIPVNLVMYGYGGQNPIRFKDDNGEFINFFVGAIAGAASDVALQVAIQVASGKGFNEIDIDLTSVGVSAATGAIGVGFAQKLSKIKQLGELSTTKLGRIGEGAVGIESKGKKTIDSLSGTAKRRNPDRIDDVSKKIEEVKNKASLSKKDADQINDTVLYAQQEGYEAVLHGRKGMKLRPEVQGLIDNGSLTYKQIPGVDAKGMKDLSNTTSAIVGSATGPAGGAATRAIENSNN